MIRSIFGRGLNAVFEARGIVVLFALMFGVGAGLGVGFWKVESAEAVENGKDAEDVYGQVQFRRGFGLPLSSDGRRGSATICSGTLISPTHVLTAKHCLKFKYAGFTNRSGRILVGDTKRGGGDPYRIKSRQEHPSADVALIELETAAPEEHVVGYASRPLEPLDELQIRGWGAFRHGNHTWSRITDGYVTNLPETLQEYTAQVLDTANSPSTDRGDRIEVRGLEGAAARPGDSGAGWYADGSIYAVHSSGTSKEGLDAGEEDVDYGVPTEDVAAWIFEKTLVAPRGDLTEQRLRRQQEQPEQGLEQPEQGLEQPEPEQQELGLEPEQQEQEQQDPEQIEREQEWLEQEQEQIEPEQRLEQLEREREWLELELEQLEPGLEQERQELELELEQLEQERQELEQRDPEEDEDSDDGDPPPEDPGEGTGSCADRPTEDTSPEGPSGTGEEPAEGTDGGPRYKGSGRGASGAAAGEAAANLTQSVQDAAGDVKKFVSKLRETYPGCNVMVIQQETYGEPQDIQGVVEDFPWKTSFGTNSWDVWVFDSGAFYNDGDMGYENWAWSGNWTRSEDKRTVTFAPMAPAEEAPAEEPVQVREGLLEAVGGNPIIASEAPPAPAEEPAEAPPAPVEGPGPPEAPVPAATDDPGVVPGDPAAPPAAPVAPAPAPAGAPPAAPFEEPVPVEPAASAYDPGAVPGDPAAPVAPAPAPAGP